MARPRSPEATACIAACREHILIDGGGDLPSVRAKFPGMSPGTFYRLVDIARQDIEASAVTEQTPGALRDAQARIRARIETPKQQERRLKTMLPASPSPAVVASMSGPAQSRVFDFLGYFMRTVTDADLVRGRAVQVQPDGTEKVVNPMLLNSSVRTRLSVLDTYLSALGEFYNLEKLQALYEIVIEEVGKESPGAKAAILARLRKLNNERGLTMAARVD